LYQPWTNAILSCLTELVRPEKFSTPSMRPTKAWKSMRRRAMTTSSKAFPSTLNKVNSHISSIILHRNTSWWNTPTPLNNLNQNICTSLMIDGIFAGNRPTKKTRKSYSLTKLKELSKIKNWLPSRGIIQLHQIQKTFSSLRVILGTWKYNARTRCRLKK
jgi:hypothetical protein